MALISIDMVDGFPSFPCSGKSLANEFGTFVNIIQSWQPISSNDDKAIIAELCAPRSPVIHFPLPPRVRSLKLIPPHACVIRPPRTAQRRAGG